MALFSLKDKSKNLKCHLLQFLFGPLRVRIITVGKLCGSLESAASSGSILLLNLTTLYKMYFHYWHFEEQVFLHSRVK